MNAEQAIAAEELEGRRVLVTGATGFIGSELVDQLVRGGAEVRALSHYRSDPGLHNLVHLDPSVAESIEVVRGDIQDPFFVRDIVSDRQLVLHLAALIAIPYSYVAPTQYVGVNVEGTINVLEACRHASVERMVHISTSECYGTAQFVPITEAHPMQGQSPYSASKISADMFVDSYYRSFELPVVVVRPFNTYGPRQSTRAVIPTIISQLLGGQEQLRLGSLDPVRDFTYCADTAAGMIAGGLVRGIEGQTFNLGTGESVTIGELASLLMGICDWEGPIITDDQRIRPAKSEVMALISDNSRAKEILGWTPKIGLEAGLQKTVDFFAEQAPVANPTKYGV